ncbi:MAG: NUDIX hydrolase [Nanoarchaeota archaeon]
MIRALIWLFGIQSATASIIVNGNKVLLTKRSPLMVEGGKWCLPGGGMRKWETALDSVKREVFEEVGIKTEKIKFLFVHEEFSKRVKVHANVFVYEIKFSGKVKINWEVSDYGWFSRSEIAKLDMAFSHKQILNKYFKLKGAK